jgi:hypothetical protein
MTMRVNMERMKELAGLPHDPEKVMNESAEGPEVEVGLDESADTVKPIKVNLPGHVDRARGNYFSMGKKAIKLFDDLETQLGQMETQLHMMDKYTGEDTKMLQGMYVKAANDVGKIATSIKKLFGQV